jgi:threonine/homoserine/homoserine lactone efflux protein
MSLHPVWLGFSVGFLAAIPLGPMGMVCVQRTLSHGRLSGLTSACGLTVAAAFWCVVAAQGLTTVAGLVAGHEAAFTTALGFFLITAGAYGLASGDKQQPRRCATYGSLAGQFISSLLGVILNPLTFLTMTAALAILGGVQADLSLQGTISLAGGVFLGGMTLWLGITHGVGLMRDHLGERGESRLSKTLNGCLLLLGVLYTVRPLLSHGIG